MHLTADLQPMLTAMLVLGSSQPALLMYNSGNLQHNTHSDASLWIFTHSSAPLPALVLQSLNQLRPGVPGNMFSSYTATAI